MFEVAKNFSPSRFGQPLRIFLVLGGLLIGWMVWGDPPSPVPPPKELVPNSKPQVTQNPGETAQPRDDSANFTFVEDRPRDEFLTLNGKLPSELVGIRIPVRVTRTGGTTWLLPVYVAKHVQLPRRGSAEPVAEVTLYDALYHPETEAAITQEMDRKFGKDNWNKAVPTDNRVAVTLGIEKGDQFQPLGFVRFIRRVDKQEVPLRIPLDVIAANELADVDRANLVLRLEETYRGRFTDPDLLATVTVTNTMATNFVNKLLADSKGQKEMLLVAIGGGLDQKASIRQVFSKQVTMEVWTRENRSVNQTLLDNVLAKLFAGIGEGDALPKQQADAVVTFLTSNGLKATAALGTFRGLKDQWRKERDTLKEGESAQAWEDRKRRAGEAGGWGVSVKFDVEDEHKESHANRFKEQFRAMDEAMKAIDGELPVAVLNADQIQKFAAQANGGIKIEIGTFSVGRKSMQHDQSLAKVFDAITAKEQVRPKTDAERHQAAVAKQTALVGKAQKELDAAISARGKIVASNTPHEEQLIKLQKKAVHANFEVGFASLYLAGLTAAAKTNFDGLDSFVRFADKEAAFRQMLANNPGIQTARTTLIGKQKALDDWTRAVKDQEAILRPMRENLALAERTITDKRAELAKLQAVLAALQLTTP